uniref:F-box/LRR-repeat protein 15/At3g58940/PEG3-like LRR domain-containing protein n=1 Tax=Solanum lycopersicum TaxID=4081 RepID=A0A3Q7IDH0_SOLLC
MSVPLSLGFTFPYSENQIDILAYLAFINGEVYYWKSCEKIKRFRVITHLRYDEIYTKDVYLWVHFATKVANVEVFTSYCQLNPCGSVYWSNLVSLSIGNAQPTDGVTEKILSSCPNLECLELRKVSGIQRLEIRSVKLRILIIEEYYEKNHDIWLEIIAPHLKHLEIIGIR